jgi:hypothetical protein
MDKIWTEMYNAAKADDKLRPKKRKDIDTLVKVL